MIAKITIGVALLLSVLVASVVPAFASSEFEAEKTWSGEGRSQIFELGSVRGECQKMTFEGVQPKATQAKIALLKPKYNECSTTVNQNKIEIKVNTGECEYELYNLEGSKSYKSNANLVNCKTGIEATGGGCTITIPEQNAVKAGEGRNLNTTKGSFESEATANLEGFKFTAKGIFCIIESGKNGSYKGTAFAKGIIVVAPEITVTPTEVKFGNTTKAEKAADYTNKGSASWIVPALEYTVIEGSAKAVTNKNGCAEKTLKPGEKCSITLIYEVPKSENYRAELKLGNEAPTVLVKAEA